MKFKFKVQEYQTNAVQSVVDCFIGQPVSGGDRYRVDPGLLKAGESPLLATQDIELVGFRNAELGLGKEQLLENIQEVQKRQGLSVSEKLVTSKCCDINLDVEMETGTGKTYCYIKTIFELNALYGWSKFIIVVPSIAIREGVLKSLEITADHFTDTYGKKARFFAYNSKQLHNLETFSSDAGINVMVINIQAFNATGKDNRRIYLPLDDFQSRKPIDVISSNRPILILDEPQKMEGDQTLEALAKFNPLMVLRYSATHRTTHNKIHRLDALDAYNQKLVKKISVRGIDVKGQSGTGAYLYLEAIEVSKTAPVARIQIEVKQKSGVIKRIVKRLDKGTNLFAESNELEQYRDFVISDINANTDTVEFKNGTLLHAGDAIGDQNEATLRRIQIREAIRAHLEREKELFHQEIKVLTLFFIDEVVKYRDYGREDEKGDYARVFEEEYQSLVAEILETLPFEDGGYRQHLERIDFAKTHSGYFSVDKKTKRLTDPAFKKKGEEAGISDDTDAYDLILKDKERLLSFEEPVRFIFSHSALREGWDNPNVFVMCMLKHSDNTISRRQEVGRGLRICVNQSGSRVDDPAIVHDVNVLTVVASESYKDFVANLQREIRDALSDRPVKVDEAYFVSKLVDVDGKKQPLSQPQARNIHRYLVRNEYVTDSDELSPKYHEDKRAGTLAELPEELKKVEKQIFELIDQVLTDDKLPEIEDGRSPKDNLLNANFERKEFKELWDRINRKAIYKVDFKSEELIEKSVVAIDTQLRVTPLQYIIQEGEQAAEVSERDLKDGTGFEVRKISHEKHNASVNSRVAYDLLGKISETTQLKRATVARILTGIQSGVFDQFKQNPEQFITEVSRLINEQKATAIIERLSYDAIDEKYDQDIFTIASKTDFAKAGGKLRKHVFDYVATDSVVERKFVADLDASSEVVVYVKLPRGFRIPTPVGNYNPDWAIAFNHDSVRHVYFVAETKGSMSSMELSSIEQQKIECARRFFKEMNAAIDEDKVTYDVVTDYGKLMDIVGGSSR